MLTRALRRLRRRDKDSRDDERRSGAAVGRASETAGGKGSAQKGAELRGRTHRGAHEGSRGDFSLSAAEAAEKGARSVSFLRRATQGEAVVNPHQRSSRRLKIPALAIFMTVSSVHGRGGRGAARRIARVPTVRISFP